MLIITTPFEIFWEKIVSFYSALVIHFLLSSKSVVVFSVGCATRNTLHLHSHFPPDISFYVFR